MVHPAIIRVIIINSKLLVYWMGKFVTSKLDCVFAVRPVTVY